AIATLRTLVPGTAEPGWRELCDALADGLECSSANGRPIELDRLKSRVYRLRAGENGTVRSLVVKRYDPWLARRNELVLRRWLPALDLSDRAPRLLATAVERGGAWAWHVYEDLAGDPLDPQDPDPLQVEAVVDVIATLHTRAAGHAVVPQCRHFCGSLDAVRAPDRLGSRGSGGGDVRPVHVPVPVPQGRASVDSGDVRPRAPARGLAVAVGAGVERDVRDRRVRAVRESHHLARGRVAGG